MTSSFGRSVAVFSLILVITFWTSLKRGGKVTLGSDLDKRIKDERDALVKHSRWATICTTMSALFVALLIFFWINYNQVDIPDVKLGAWIVFGLIETAAIALPVAIFIPGYVRRRNELMTSSRLRRRTTLSRSSRSTY